MSVKPPSPFHINCVCGDSIRVTGAAHTTVAIRKEFIDDHAACRVQFDQSIDRITMKRLVNKLAY